MSESCFWCLKRSALMHWMQREKNSSLQSIVSEKIWKNVSKICHFWPFWLKLVNFLGFTWFVAETIPCKGLNFLRCIQGIRALLSRYQKQLSDNFSDFSSSSDLEWVKISLLRFIVVLQSKLKMFFDQAVKYYTKSRKQNITKVHFCLYLLHRSSTVPQQFHHC